MIYQMDVIPGDLWTVNCTVSTLTGRLLGQPAAPAQDDIPDGRHPGRSVDRQLHGNHSIYAPRLFGITTYQASRKKRLLLFSVINDEIFPRK